MEGHEPVSDAGLLFGSIFVAVAIVGIGILGGQQGTVQMAAVPGLAMTAAPVPAPLSQPAKQKCLPKDETNSADIHTPCVDGCHYLVKGGGFPVAKASLTATNEYSDGSKNPGTVQFIPYGGSSWTSLTCKGGSASTLGDATGAGAYRGLAGLVGSEPNSLNVQPPTAPAATAASTGAGTPSAGTSVSGSSANPGGTYSPGSVQTTALNPLTGEQTYSPTYTSGGGTNSQALNSFNSSLSSLGSNYAGELDGVTGPTSGSFGTGPTPVPNSTYGTGVFSNLPWGEFTPDAESSGAGSSPSANEIYGGPGSQSAEKFYPQLSPNATLNEIYGGPGSNSASQFFPNSGIGSSVQDGYPASVPQGVGGPMAEVGTMQASPLEQPLLSADRTFNGSLGNPLLQDEEARAARLNAMIAGQSQAQAPLPAPETGGPNDLSTPAPLTTTPPPDFKALTQWCVNGFNQFGTCGV